MQRLVSVWAMAYHGSPQDLFASEDSDSDATVDLSTAQPPQYKDFESDSQGMPKQNKHQRSVERRPRHHISSSESDDDSVCSPSIVNRCSSRDRFKDSAHADVVVTTCDNNAVVIGADKRACSEQSVSKMLDDRPLCKYGEKCYRRNPNHFQEFRHPGNWLTVLYYFSTINLMIESEYSFFFFIFLLAMCAR